MPAKITPEVLAEARRVREAMFASQKRTLDRIATAAPVAGHRVTVTAGDHPNTRTLTCTCGHTLTAAARFADLMVAEHERIPAAHLTAPRI